LKELVPGVGKVASPSPNISNGILQNLDFDTGLGFGTWIIRSLFKLGAIKYVINAKTYYKLNIHN